MNELDSLTIVVKTILRYHCLRKTVAAFHAIDPSLKIIIIDDSPMESRQTVEGQNIDHVFTEVDIGVSAGRNLGFQLASTEYIFYTDDDDYPIMTREQLLENFRFVKDGNCDLLGFKGCSLAVDDSTKICSMAWHKVTGFQKTDLTTNSFIAKKSFLLENPFYEKIKNIGEHYLFFFELKTKGAKVFASDSLRFTRLNARNPAYNEFRRRNFRNFAVEKSGYTPKWPAYSQTPQRKSF